MSTILHKMVYRDTDPNGFVHLHSAVLRRVLSNDNMAFLVQALVQADAIEVSSYCASRYTRG